MHGSGEGSAERALGGRVQKYSDIHRVGFLVDRSPAEYPVDITGHILADGVGSSLWNDDTQQVLSPGYGRFERLGGQRCFVEGLMQIKGLGTIQFAFDGAAQTVLIQVQQQGRYARFPDYIEGVVLNVGHNQHQGQRHQEQHQQSCPVADKREQVLVDEPDQFVCHQSLSLLPVSLR